MGGYQPYRNIGCIHTSTFGTDPSGPVEKDTQETWTSENLSVSRAGGVAQSTTSQTPAEITLNELRTDDNANHANQQEGVQGLGYVAGLSLEVHCCTRSPDEVMWTESIKYRAPLPHLFHVDRTNHLLPKKQ